MKKIMLSMFFTEEEAKNVKKAFEQATLRKPPFWGKSGSGTKKNLLIGGKGKRRKTMRNYNEFKDYLKQRTDTSNNDFRRRCLVECLDDYMDELLDRRNIHESDSEEYRKLEKRRVELSKLIEIISEERRLAKLYKML